MTAWRRVVITVGGTGDAWAALGRQLAASRRAAGLSQHQLAALAGYSRSTIANAETGRQRVPHDFWARCDAVLGTGSALSRGHEEVRAVERQGHVSAAAAARSARIVRNGRIRADSAGLGESPAGSAPGSPGLDVLESLRQRLTSTLAPEATISCPDAWEEAALHHGRATRFRRPGELVTDLSADLTELEPVIRQCRSVSSLRRLVRVAAQMAGLMCLLFVRVDDPTAFRRWASTARAAALEASDPGTLAWALAQEAHGYYYSADFPQALTTARHAQAVMRRTPCVGTALAAALEARAHAALGDARSTKAALGRAEDILDRLDGSSTEASAFGYSESQFWFHTENAYTLLRDVRPALNAQEHALQACPPADYTDWALIRLDRAACLARGDADAALAYAAETMAELRGEQSRGIIARRGRELLQALPVNYRRLPAAREFEEMLRAPAGT